MSPAGEVRDRRAVRLLVIDPIGGRLIDRRPDDLAELLAPGDVLVVNDAATLPASLSGHASSGEPLEIRLAAEAPHGFWAVVFGAGDWRLRTEDRPLPPRLPAGTRLRFDGGLVARVVRQSPRSPRLIEIELNRRGDALYAALYAVGRPIQYAYHRAPLPLWSVQTVYGGRPLAFEMPSAGRPLTWSILLALRRYGVGVARVTHAAGLSSTGDPHLDAALPLPERYEVPAETVAHIEAARAAGRRVVAVGTTVVRALEGAAARHDRLQAGSGITDIRLGPGFQRRVVTDLLTGMHVPAESHYELLGSFVPAELLARATRHAEQAGYLSHEFGDLTLVLRRAPSPPALARQTACSGDLSVRHGVPTEEARRRRSIDAGLLVAQRVESRLAQRPAGGHPAGEQGEATGQDHAPHRREHGEVMLDDVADEDREGDVYPEPRRTDADQGAEQRPRQADDQRLQPHRAGDHRFGRADQTQRAHLAPPLDDLGGEQIDDAGQGDGDHQELDRVGEGEGAIDHALMVRQRLRDG
jgi:S-adenosylmethionine:tRNA ribosyltransferase-isomerase